MIAASKCINKIPCKSFSNKRSFWKIAEKTMKVQIKSVGKKGVIFNHTNIGCSLNDMNLNPIYNLPTDSVPNSFNISFDKFDPRKDPVYIDELIELMNKKKDLCISVETHVFGNPMKGFMILPHYLKDICLATEWKSECRS